MFDVVISGAGPSGSQCAKVIAEKGYKVALIEKDVNWRKPCGGAVHSSVIDLYPQLEKLNSPKIRGLVMYSADYHRLEFKGASSEYSIIMDRLELDNIMRNTAVDVGAKLFDNHISVDYLMKNQKKVGIKTKAKKGSKEFHGNIIIVADGMSSKLAVKSGIRSKWNVNELAIGKCSIMEGNHGLDLESVYVYFKPFQGYAWIFPIDNRRYNIGIFTFGKDNLKYNIHEVYHEFVNHPNVKQYISNSNNQTIWSSSYSFPANGVLEKNLYDDKLMLIGDAGGFVSPISGEGIQTAVLSGKIAAETAIKSLQDEDYSRSSLKNYRTNQEIKTIIRNFKQKSSMTNFFYEYNGKNLNKLLELAESDAVFREQVVNMFAFGEMPSKELISKINK
ncbi:MAG: NAD(P)/FAD-dependent oxidoreductase [Candidatus Thorarchaeota archaeon]